MGILKDTKITLINGSTKKISYFDYTEDLMSCIIINKDNNNDNDILKQMNLWMKCKLNIKLQKVNF